MGLKAIRAGDIHNEVEFAQNDVSEVLYYKKSEADKCLDHHKYKRCVAQFKRCKDMSVWWNDEQVSRLKEQMGNAESRRFLEAHNKFVFFCKWEFKWLELAKRFKG